MLNFLILFLQILVICGFTIAAVRMGEAILNSWLCILAVAMNVFVLKQITLFTLDVTATDSIAVSYILGLNVLQEYFGSSAARRHALLAIFVCAGFLMISSFHLLFTPNAYDFSSESYQIIFCCMPRLVIASFTSFFLVQFSDIAIFSWVRKKFAGRLFFMRMLICAGMAQALDTVIFTFLGLYGIIHNVWHVILISLIFKILVLFLSAPFLLICKKLVKVPERDRYLQALLSANQ